MTIRRIDDGFSVSTQLHLEDVEALPEQGIRMLINNRPDGEDPAQPSSAEVEARARAAGLDYRHIPVVSGTVPSDEQVAAFRAALANDGPALAFCRSGTRSTVLWALSQKGSLDADSIIEKAGEAGYNISDLRGRLSD